MLICTSFKFSHEELWLCAEFGASCGKSSTSDLFVNSISCCLSRCSLAFFSCKVYNKLLCILWLYWNLFILSLLGSRNNSFCLFQKYLKPIIRVTLNILKSRLVCVLSESLFYEQKVKIMKACPDKITDVSLQKVRVWSKINASGYFRGAHF